MPYSGTIESVNYFFNLIGMIGVPSFLIVSGFLGYGRQFSLTKQLHSLFIPLVIIGSFEYLISHYNSHLNFAERIVDLLKWLYGCGSWLYFVMVLFWCKIISLPKNDYYQYILIMVSIASIVLTSCNKIAYNDYFTEYTNPFNFLIYFQVGRFIRKYEINLEDHRLQFGSLIAMILMCIFWNELPSYFSLFAIPASLSAYVILYWIASFLRIGEEVGRLSYVIYLIHLIPAGIINRYGLECIGACFDFIKVPLTFIVIFSVVWFGRFCLKRMNLNALLPYFGYR